MTGMKTLTLKQVREAGLNAEHPVDTYVGWDWRVRFEEVVWVDSPLVSGTTVFGEWGAGLPLPEDGWHHADDCDCEFCST